MSNEMVLVKKSDLEAAIAAMTETRRASIEGCNVGYVYNNPDGGPWAEDLYASHGGLTKSIKTLETSINSNNAFIEACMELSVAVGCVVYYGGAQTKKWWGDLLTAQGKFAKMIPEEKLNECIRILINKVDM